MRSLIEAPAASEWGGFRAVRDDGMERLAEGNGRHACHAHPGSGHTAGRYSWFA